jgi:hypothetical protein
VKIRKCKTCGIPLWIAYFIYGFPFQERAELFKDADDCVDLITKAQADKLYLKALQETYPISWKVIWDKYIKAR